MPRKHGEGKFDQRQTHSRLHRIRRTVYKLLLAIVSPGDDIDTEVSEADVREAVHYLREVCGRTGQADSQTTG